ncbi:MAG: hypothetical protein KatS3mg034_1350 [Vicingaceae bacterium]|nr:MAG: hypothetical protein KatS3mg034_1350 [Vicingaceae bacterium]
MSLKITVISFENPFPPDYGGAIDVYYKIKNLKKLGTKIRLIFFTRKRRNFEPLRPFCDEVYLFPQSQNPFLLLKNLPLAVLSRYNNELLRLLKSADDNDILFFEGLQTTAILNYFTPSLAVLLRLHNWESEYYKMSGKQTSNILKKLYFSSESKKFDFYEKFIFSKFNHVFAISQTESKLLSNLSISNDWLPPFHPFDEIILNHPEQIEPFILYHGNLTIPENIRSVEFIVKKIAPLVKHKIFIAGKYPHKSIVSWIKQQKNIELIQPKNHLETIEWIKKAKINLLLTFQPTGIKLKLLYALFSGNLVVANKEMLTGTGLNNMVTETNNDPHLIAEKLNKLMEARIDRDTLYHHKSEALKIYDNLSNAQKIVDTAKKF